MTTTPSTTHVKALWKYLGSRISFSVDSLSSSLPKGCSSFIEPFAEEKATTSWEESTAKMSVSILMPR